MIALWIAAFLALAAAAALVVLYSLKPVAVVADPAQTVYLRQLTEFDELAERGLMTPDEHALAKAEAARRALREQSGSAETEPSKLSRVLVLGAIALVGVVSLVAYMAVGKPGFPDQPYKARLESWREMVTPEGLGSLQPAQIAALLEERARETPNDADLLRFLAEMQARAGDPLTASRTLEQSLKIDPRSVEAWSRLGELRVMLADNKVTPKAREALDRALALDAKAPVPRFLIGQAEIDAGRRAQGVAIWRAMLPDLGEEERAVIEREIAKVEGPGGAAGGAVDPAIKGMVDRLAARLKENPDDPAGWARLVRSYKVLGDQAALQRALDEARLRFKDRPRDLNAIEAAVNEAP